MSMKGYAIIVCVSVCLCEQRSVCVPKIQQIFERIKEGLQRKEILNVIGEAHRHAVCYSRTHSCPSCRNMFVFVVKEKQE